MSGYVNIPVNAGGIQIYPTASSFPITADDGEQAVAADTNTIYIYDSGVPGWQAVATPGASIAITALQGDVTADGPGAVAATVQYVGGATATAVALSVIDVQAATPLPNPLTIVKRDDVGAAGFTGIQIGDISGPGIQLNNNNLSLFYSDSGNSIKIDSSAPELKVESGGLYSSLSPAALSLVDPQAPYNNTIELSAAGSFINLVSIGTAAITVTGDSGQSVLSNLYLQSLELRVGNVSNNVSVTASPTTSYGLVLPPDQGAASTFLQNDGSGALSWQTALTSINSSTVESQTLVPSPTVSISTDVLSGSHTFSLPFNVTTWENLPVYTTKSDPFRNGSYPDGALMATIPQASFFNPGFFEVYQGGNLLEFGVDYELYNSEASASAGARALYINGINNPSEFPFFDRIHLLNENTDPVTVVYKEKFLPVQYSMGIALWNWQTNNFLAVGTTGLSSGTTFTSLRNVPTVFNVNANLKIYLTALEAPNNTTPYITESPNGALSQRLQYGGGTPNQKTLYRVLPNMAFIRELPLDFDFEANGLVVEVWAVQRIKRPQTDLPLPTKRQRITPMAIFKGLNKFKLNKLIVYPSNTGKVWSRRIRNSRTLKFRLRRLSDNAVSPFFQNKIYVNSAGKRITVQGTKIGRLFEVYLV